eukprot:CAMPEP_0113895076 /NCGR_PEP_ID=MMETSP0780_2-20120614/17128_1 /TAXON_ID=652834 /ORGANISM="Palpitomonas bilix" /LENGTH=61 /DNA_ID=CAMNT_0000885799 /DNA_START=188 /DNA_END=373 /DNA_ORIENTATION=- /assembly_acc=CAM_ASM_000599
MRKLMATEETATNDDETAALANIFIYMSAILIFISLGSMYMLAFIKHDDDALIYPPSKKKD